MISPPRALKVVGSCAGDRHQVPVGALRAAREDARKAKDLAAQVQRHCGRLDQIVCELMEALPLGKREALRRTADLHRLDQISDVEFGMFIASVRAILGGA